MILRKSNFNLLKNKSRQDGLYFAKFLLFVALFGQVAIWRLTENIVPNLGILPPLPNRYETEIFSFGDKELYFRFLSSRIQHAGDTFGRATPLKDYDYKLLYQWLILLDDLDSKSNLMPSVASYYYASTQRTSDVRYITDYLWQRGEKAPATNWWWLYQGTILANYVLKDARLALKFAEKLRISGPDDMPIWAYQLSAMIHADLGEMCQSYLIIKSILDDYQNGSKHFNGNELNFMNYFIEQRLGTFKKNGFDPSKCNDS